MQSPDAPRPQKPLVEAQRRAPRTPPKHTGREDAAARAAELLAGARASAQGRAPKQPPKKDPTRHMPNKQIIEARSRAISDLDRAQFAPFEALFGGPAISPQDTQRAIDAAQAAARAQREADEKKRVAKLAAKPDARQKPGKTIIEARSRGVSDRDKDLFAPFEAMFDKSAGSPKQIAENFLGKLRRQRP